MTQLVQQVTNTKDQNSLTTLASTLSPLANNGGAVPTRALINGSPAIDSGLTLANILTDARGVARPAGLAFDSGAYESPFTAPQPEPVVTPVTPTPPATPATITPQKLAETGQSVPTLIILSAILSTLSIAIVWRQLRLTAKA